MGSGTSRNSRPKGNSLKQPNHARKLLGFSSLTQETTAPPDAPISSKAPYGLRNYQTITQELHSAPEALFEEGESHGIIEYAQPHTQATGAAVQRISGPTLRRPIEGSIRWRLGTLLGAGSYGRVHLALNSDTGELFAAKQYPILIGDEEQTKTIEATIKEIGLMKDLSHVNTVRYLGFERGSDYMYVFMEYVSGGSLTSLLQRFGPFPEKLVQIYTKQIVSGVEYLHSKGIVHRDIKGANILVDTNGTVKLADFGASIQGESSLHSVRGTPNWMAPESVTDKTQGPEADIWSLGCTVIEMLSAKPPWFHVMDATNILLHIASTKKLPRIPSNASTDAHRFILSCLKRNPAERPSASELAKMSFISTPLEILMTSVKSFPVIFQEYFRDDTLNGTMISMAGRTQDI